MKLSHLATALALVSTFSTLALAASDAPPAVPYVPTFQLESSAPRSAFYTILPDSPTAPVTGELTAEESITEQLILTLTTTLVNAILQEDSVRDLQGPATVNNPPTY